MTTCKVLLPQSDGLYVDTYGPDFKPRRQKITPRTEAPASWGDIDYSTALRLPEGLNGISKDEFKELFSFGSKEDILPNFRRLYEVFRPREWAGRPHQVKWQTAFAKWFNKKAKPRFNFPGKTKARKELAGLIADEIANDPSGKLGLIPPGESDGRRLIHVGIERWAAPGTIVVTWYGPDGDPISARWYDPVRPRAGRDFAWLPYETVIGLAEGFHRIESPEPKPVEVERPRFLTGIQPAVRTYHWSPAVAEESDAEVATPSIEVDKPRFRTGIRAVASTYRLFVAASEEPEEEVATPAPDPAPVATPPAWVIPAARLILVDGKLAAMTLRVPRGPVEVRADEPPSWGPAESGGSAWQLDGGVGFAGPACGAHVARGPPALAGPREAL